MDIQRYIQYLHTFYTYIAAHPWAKLSLQDHVYPARVHIGFQHDFVLMDYNLGFRVGKLCYVFQKLAQENVQKLETIMLSQEKDKWFINVQLKKKKCVIRCYDIYGKTVYKTKIKFATINWWR